ncbi:MAG: cupin domain-containing protein [Bacteroidota bacterium]
MKKAQYWIKHLNLERHPEGGYYAELFRSEINIPKSVLPAHYSGDRSLATQIYFLVDKAGFSAFHRLDSDELWHFYQGNPLQIHLIHPNGSYENIWLGDDIEADQHFYARVPAGVYFAAEVENEEEYSLVGCTMAPGFDFEGFELPKANTLIEQYPQHGDLIERLTRH